MKRTFNLNVLHGEIQFNSPRRWIDDLRFYVFLTVFLAYQDDGQVIMKDCVQWNPFTIEKISATQERLEPGTARSVGQC